MIQELFVHRKKDDTHVGGRRRRWLGRRTKRPKWKKVLKSWSMVGWKGRVGSASHRIMYFCLMMHLSIDRFWFWLSASDGYGRTDGQRERRGKCLLSSTDRIMALTHGQDEWTDRQNKHLSFFVFYSSCSSFDFFVASPSSTFIHK